MKLILEGEDREKIRIASELHDGIGQYLSAATMNFNSIQDEVDESGEELKKGFNNGLTFLNQAIVESRVLTSNLIPGVVKDFGFVYSMEVLIQKLNGSSRTEFKFIHQNFKKRLPENIELHLYRIGQECLNNVIKHSQAKTATLQIVLKEKSIHLTCEDDGIGFKLKSKLKHVNTYGLQSLYHRTTLLEGTINIESEPQKGTLVSIDIPLTN